MKTKIELKRINGEVIFSHVCEDNSIAKTIDVFRMSDAEFDLSGVDLQNSYLGFINFRDVNLSGSNLDGANLEHATLINANLSNAKLNYANLRCACLNGANLSNTQFTHSDLGSTNLCNVNLEYANLGDANLRYAVLINTNLRYTNLNGANLSDTDLSNSDLRGSSLRYTNLSNANLNNANLHNIDFSEKTAFLLPQCPSEGSFVAWKKASGKIVKLLVTEDAKRSSATTLKCRCSKAKVLAIENEDGSESELKEIESSFDSGFVYRVGETVEVYNFDDNGWKECSTGIHFFIARAMAVEY